MPYSRVSPARAPIELLGSSSYAEPSMAIGLDEEIARLEDEGETVEAVETKLAIERRVQYGAEKMLDVIDKRSGGGDGGEQEQVKERIAAQLEAANDRITLLEARLERLKAGTTTPQRTRRRPSRLHANASSTSLAPSLSSSFSSSTMLSASVRPRLPRQASNLTPERDPASYPLPPSGQGTPSTRRLIREHSSPKRRPRSMSAGDDFRLTPLTTDAGGSRMGWAGGIDDGETSNVVGVLVHRLVDFRRREAGKGKEADRGDEEWDILMRLGEALKSVESLKPADLGSFVESLLPSLADSSTTRKRAASYRILRYILDRRVWGVMIHAGIEWLIVRTFTRDGKAIHEREEALKLMRAVMTLPPPSFHPSPTTLSGNASPLHSRSNHSRQPSWQNHTRRTSGGGHSRQGSGSLRIQGPYASEQSSVSRLLAQKVPLSDGMVRAIVSAAENPDDPLRVASMLTLIEIAALDLRCLLQSDAFRTVLLVFKDGPPELSGGVAGLLSLLVDRPASRQYLLVGSDLEVALAGLTEEFGKVPSRQQAKHAERLTASIVQVRLLLSSWSGLIYLCADNLRAIKSIVSALHVPLSDVKEAVLDLLFFVLRIKSLSWRKAFLDGKRLTVYHRTQEAAAQLQEGLEDEGRSDNLNLVDQFVALLLAAFIEAGLLESLVILIEDSGSPLDRKATLLLGEILQMANRILPLQYAAQLQALPRLFSAATKFMEPSARHAALSALSSIDSLNRNHARLAKHSSRAQSTTAQDSLERGQKQVQQAKLRLGLHIEDKQFQQMVNDSGVLLGRDHTKWNYDVVLDLIEGPLLNPKRLDEAIRATKFVRRLFSFYHPFNNRFSSVKRTRPNHKWVRLGCALLSTMLASPEGIRFISEDKLLPQMVECFNELDQCSGIPSAQPVLARDRIENSLTYGYFEMIGTLSRHREGVKLMEKFRFFTCFYHLSEQRSRDDIIRIIIECFDYTIDAHPRIVLAKALTSAYMETRLFATHHLGRLLHEAASLREWALQLMATQLYDTSLEVCDVAVMHLEEMCHDPECLKTLVQLRPSLEHLGDVGHPLFMRFVSTTVGFQYLHQSQYIDRELDNWLSERNLLYVIETETFVTKTIRPFTTDRVQDYWDYDSTAPTHFFGELTKTPEGCQLLKERGIVADFAEMIRLHGLEDNDQALLTNVKSVLWALGNIGSSEGGLPFLEDEEIIEAIIEIAERSPVLSMRGTAFFVLGLLSSSRMGAEILEEYGWVSTRTSMGMTTGLCLPNDISRFTHIESWDRTDCSSDIPPLPRLTGLEGEIMTSIANLSNYVLAAGAMNNLKKIRLRHPRYFASITLFHRALRTISTNHYQAPVRRFILELFDIPLEEETILRLRHLEVQSYLEPKDTYSRTYEGGEDHEDAHRRRSASSPGPEPLQRQLRTRGLTFSTPGAEERDSGPKERQRGFGIAVA